MVGIAAVFAICVGLAWPWASVAPLDGASRSLPWQLGWTAAIATFLAAGLALSVTDAGRIRSLAALSAGGLLMLAVALVGSIFAVHPDLGRVQYCRDRGYPATCGGDATATSTLVAWIVAAAADGGALLVLGVLRGSEHEG